MTTIDFITALFCQVDDHLSAVPKHPEVPLRPRAVGPVGLRPACTGVGNRALSRWCTRDDRALCPQLGLP